MEGPLLEPDDKVEVNARPEGEYTCQEAINAVDFGRFQMVLGVLAGALFSTDAIQMTLLAFISSAARCTFNLSLSEAALIASICFGGNLLGSYVCGTLADKYGRRVVFLGAATTICVFSVASGLAPSYEMLLLAQFLVGLGIGAVPVAFTLFSECVPIEGRGSKLAQLQVSWTVGCIGEAAMAWAVMPALGWRWVVVFSATPSFMLLLCSPLLPESPKWQVTHGKRAEAFATLKQMAEDNGTTDALQQLGDESQLQVGERHFETFVQVEPEPQNDIGIMDLFKDGFAFLTVVVWALWVLCTLLYYAAILLATEMAQVEGKTMGVCDPISDWDYLRAAITATAELPAFVACVLMVDRLGRAHTIAISFVSKPTLLLFKAVTQWVVAAMAGCLVAILMVAGNQYLETTCLFGARAAVMCGCLAIYIGTGELYPTEMRTTGLGTANSLARIGGFLAPFIASVLLDTSRVMSMLSLGGISMLTAYVGLKLPDTSSTV